MNFASLIRSFPAATEIMASDTERMTAGDLIDLGEGSREHRPKWSDMRVLVATRSVSDALRLITILEGTAAAIGFASPELPAKDLSSIAAKGGFDAVIGDRPDEASTPEGVACFEDFSSFMKVEFAGKPLKSDMETKWLLTTSGTTGEPKIVEHSLGTLTRTTKTAAQPLDTIRWGMLYDYTRFAGLQVMLQSVLSGALLIVPDSTAGLDRQLSFLSRMDVTHLSATPTLWRKLLMTQGIENLALKCATLGGEIADQRILDALSRAFPKAVVIHIFASTETGVGFSVKDGLEGFPLSFLTSPPAGVGLRLKNDILQVQNRKVGGHYIGTDNVLADEDGWISTDDLVCITGDRVRFLGRSSGTINVGGNKVQPELVEAALNAHPAVSMSRAYSKKNPITGALVAADIVLSDSGRDHDEVRAEIKSSMAESLRPFQIPAIIRIVDSLNINASGKVERK